MARPKSALPQMRAHLSGQGFVRIDDRNFYLGRYGSPESLARYAVLIAEYQARNLTLPNDFDVRAIDDRAGLLLAKGVELPAEHLENNQILVKHVTAAYREHIRSRYANAKTESHRLNQVCDELDTRYKDLPAVTFGPRALQEQRQRWVDSGSSRVYCNRLTNCIVRIFKWAVSQELVLESTWTRLKSVEPLRCGQTEAPETKGVVPVAIEHVRATAKFLTPIVKAMLRIHVATGMRPSELCRLRPCDIDRTGQEWFYRPPKHKNANKGKTRAIPFVGDARDALEDYINRDPQSYCFSPKESMAWYRAKLRSECKGYGSYKRKKERPSKEPGDCYDSGSYRQAIQRAAKQAKVPSWHPYQIRHLAGTVVRDALGPEAAQAMLGHAHIQMTEHYAKVSEKKAIEAARHAPKL